MSNLLSILMIAVAFFIGMCMFSALVIVLYSIPKVRRAIVKWSMKFSMEIQESIEEETWG